MEISSIDLGFITLDGPDSYVEYLDYCKQHDCVPNEFTARCFQCDYSEVSRDETEDKISAKGEWLCKQRRPAFRLYLTGMPEGFYDKKSYSISREHGSSYDAYMAMGAPKTLSENSGSIWNLSPFRDINLNGCW